MLSPELFINVSGLTSMHRCPAISQSPISLSLIHIFQFLMILNAAHLQRKLLQILNESLLR